MWEDDSGAALWIQIRDGAITGAHPFFAAGSIHPARIEGAEADPESGPDTAWDGQARLFLLPNETVLLPVDVINWPLASESLKPQGVASVRLVAFAESLMAWDSPEVYAASHPESRHQGHRWIVPTGLYPESKGGTGRATATITGMVAQAEARVNRLTGAPFRWLRLETTGPVLDVVAADGPLPPTGGVVRGHFWLAGQVDRSTPGAMV